MTGKLDIWRQRSWIWWLPALFVVLNVLLLAFYQTRFAGRVEDLESSYQKGAEDLQSLRRRGRDIERLLASVEDQDHAAARLYRVYFATEAERFTDALREIRTLARRAGLDPSSFSYPSDENEARDVVRRGINFSVKGTYEQLRTFINLLELTDQFLTLESVSLGGGRADRDPNLSIRLSLSTIFALDDAPELEAELPEVSPAAAPPEEGAGDGDGDEEELPT